MQKGIIQDKSQQQYQNSATYSVLYSDAYVLKKDVAIYIVKQTLLESGTETFEMVNRCLLEKYCCEISDCFEKPEYLIDVLKYVYDGTYSKFVESVKKNLKKFSQESGIKEFIEKLDVNG